MRSMFRVGEAQLEPWDRSVSYGRCKQNIHTGHVDQEGQCMKEAERPAGEEDGELWSSHQENCGARTRRPEITHTKGWNRPQAEHSLVAEVPGGGQTHRKEEEEDRGDRRQRSQAASDENFVVGFFCLLIFAGLGFIKIKHQQTM